MPATPGLTPVSPRLASPGDVPRPRALVPIATRADLSLDAQLRLILGADLEGYAVVAVDLETGRSVSINEELVFYAASVFKTWVMYEVFHQESLGLFDLEDELLLTPYYDAFGLGPRATQLCQQLTILEAMGAMMSISDNAAAVLLQDLVGAPNINGSLEALGLTQSRLTPEDIPITAKDMARLLELIGTGKAVNRQASQVMASLMLAEGFDNGLRSSLPREASVAHKTGNWPNARHDAGIVFAPQTTYVVAILSDNREGSLATIKAIASAIYESFNR
jgi:beta-lactamase class A